MPDRPNAEHSDEDLIAAIAPPRSAAAASAFATLVARHQAAVFRLARHLTHDPAAAEDVLQETFLSVLQSASSFRGDATGRAWIFAIARHAAWKHARRAQRTEPAAEPTLESLGRDAGWGITDAEAMLIEREQRASLAEALAGLAPGDREVLLLRDVEGLSGAEAAHALGIDLTAMKSRLHRARLRLQAVCHREGSA